jgi:microcystin-dependent protein
VRFPQADNGPTDFLSRAWPVGSVYTSADDVSPADKMGFGVWEEFAVGRVLVGLDAGQAEFDAIGETGGAKTVTLTAAQLPAHTHSVTDPGHTHVQQAHSHVQSVNTAITGGLSGYTPDTSTNTSAASGYSTQPTTAVNNTATTGITVNGGGSGQSHQNLPPYITVRFWKRTG